MMLQSSAPAGHFTGRSGLSAFVRAGKGAPRLDAPQLIISELQSRHNLTEVQIAKLACTSQPTVSRLLNTAAITCKAGLYIRLVELRERFDAGVHTAADAADAPGLKPRELGVSLESTPGA